jgi:hypothetical protein
MAFTPDDPNIRKVGDPLTAEIMQRIWDNLTDLDSRQNASETTGGSVFIFNGDISLAGLDPLDPVVFYYKATQDFSITDVRGQIFSKGSYTIGTLALDVEKATNTNDANFNSILSSVLSFDFATDPSYHEDVAGINTSLNDIVAGEVIRVVVTSTPTNFGGKLLLTIGAE